MHSRLHKSVNINDTLGTLQRASLSITHHQIWHCGHAALKVVDGDVFLEFLAGSFPECLRWILCRVSEMDLEIRETIRNMPYRKRNHGLSAAEVYDLGLLIKFNNFLIRFADYIPFAPLRNLVLLFAMMLSFVVLNVLCVQSTEVNKVNSANKNRMFDSFTDEECWHNLRFRRDELILLFELSGFPAVVTCTNGLSCPGEHAFMLMLYRLAYPCRLFTLQDIFGREYTQLSRIFKFAVNFIYTNHKHRWQSRVVQ